MEVASSLDARTDDGRSTRRPHSILALLLAIIAAGSTLFFFTTHPTPQNNYSYRRQRDTHRQLSSLFRGPSVENDNLLLARYADPKSVVLRSSTSKSSVATNDADDGVQHRRTNCQIIYVLGVEGSIHHGFMPVIKSLAERQFDPLTGTQYHVVKGHDDLRAAIFRSSACSREEKDEGLCVKDELQMNDPSFVRATLDKICPNPKEVWRKHVIIEGNSFPSGREKEKYLVTRQRDWPGMTPEQISSSETALNHPTNLYKFFDSFSPHADVRFVVLHRPYLETIASHPNFDGGPEKHSVVISGFIILLSRFLMSHMYSPAWDGSVPLWTIVCADRLTSKSFQNENQLSESRERVLGYLANFLGWPDSSCPECFDEWVESKKKSSPQERLGEEATGELLDHARLLESIWPPRRLEDGLPQQQCGLL